MPQPLDISLRRKYFKIPPRPPESLAPLKEEREKEEKATSVHSLALSYKLEEALNALMKVAEYGVPPTTSYFLSLLAGNDVNSNDDDEGGGEEILKLFHPLEREMPPSSVGFWKFLEMNNYLRDIVADHCDVRGFIQAALGR